MTRTKCEIEQLGGNKSALTTKSDQHVAAAAGAPSEFVLKLSPLNGEYSSHYCRT